MTYFAGLDVSMKETAICVVDDDGSTIWEGKTRTEVEAIVAAWTDRLGDRVAVTVDGDCNVVSFEGTGTHPNAGRIEFTLNRG